MGYRPVRGLPFWVEEHGDGEPLVLVVHGTGGHSGCFDRVVPSLARRGRVLVYDRRGFGRTGGILHPHRGYFREHALDAAALVEAAHARRATVLGWSSGAIVALHLAIERPDLVGRLVLFEPAVHVGRQRPSARMVMHMGRLFLWEAVGRRRRAARAYLRLATLERGGRCEFDRLDGETRRDLLDHADAVLFELHAGTGEELEPEQIRNRLEVPAALIIGERSAPFLAKATNDLAAVIARCPVVRVPRGGHLLPMTDPERFVHAFDQAIEQLAPGRISDAIPARSLGAKANAARAGEDAA